MALLAGPVLPALLKLALPTVVVLVVQTLVGVAETYFVSFLGTEALAGVSLVFPIFMLMQMMSNGGIGGGVASAIARAIGAGKVAEAEALALNALVLAIVFGVIFAGAEWLFGEAVYRLLGGQAGALGAALEYGHAHLFRRDLCLDRQPSGGGPSRCRQHGGAGGRHYAGCVRAASTFAGADFRLGPFSPARRYGSRARCRRLLSRRGDCVDRLHAFRAGRAALAA